MSRPTRPPGPPYPDEPYPSEPYPDEPYPDSRQPPPPPPAPPPPPGPPAPTAQPRFTPRTGPQQQPRPGPPQGDPRQHGGGPPTGPEFSPTPPPPPPSPGTRATQPQAPSRDVPGQPTFMPDSRDAAGQPTFTPDSRDAAGQPTFTPDSRGGRHGGRPRPSFTPREGYAPPADGRRRETAPPPTAFFSPAPAGYQPVPVPEEFGYAPTAAPRFTPVDRQAQRDDQDNRTRILERPVGAAPATGPQRTADDTSPNLARSSKAMAFGTIASRGTGFLRTFVLLYRPRRRLGSRARTTTPTRCRTPCTTSCWAVSSPRSWSRCWSGRPRRTRTGARGTRSGSSPSAWSRC